MVWTDHAVVSEPASETREHRLEREPVVTFGLGDLENREAVSAQIEAKSCEARNCPHVDTDVDPTALQQRKKYLRHRRHTLPEEHEEDWQAPYHHTQRMHLRRALARMVHRHGSHGNHKQEPHKQLAEEPHAEGKVKKNVSFAAQPLEEHSLLEVTSTGTDDIKSTEAESSGVTFSLASDSDSEMNSAKNGSDQSEENVEPAEPTAVEMSLPWKRNTGRPPISSSFTHSLPDDDHPQSSVPPSWVDNEQYVTVPEPLPHPAEPIDMSCSSCLHLRQDENDASQQDECVCHESENTDSVLPPPWKSNNHRPNGYHDNSAYHGNSGAPIYDHDNGNICKHSGTTESRNTSGHNDKINTYRDGPQDVDFSLPPLPWKRPVTAVVDMSPILSPTVSNDIESSLRPQVSSHSLRLSEAESRHSEHIHMHHVMDLPSHHSCPALAEMDLPLSDDEEDTIDRVHAWLSGLECTDIVHGTDPTLEDAIPAYLPMNTCALEDMDIANADSGIVTSDTTDSGIVTSDTALVPQDHTDPTLVSQDPTSMVYAQNQKS